MRHADVVQSIYQAGENQTVGYCFCCSYLNVVQAVEQRGFLHPEVVRYQGVEAIGEIQDVGLRQTFCHSL